ncbi:UvrD-helicase domain-containing protein [Vibrio sp. TRT 17S01]|uniref:UvrD-helicase domain-containing protein n=1 Tax=Vibrio sp. TRT 17S01 TaxID=3418505 RepID=UPI003CF3AC51
MSAEIILENEIGAIEAPAGCGKTQLIVEALAIPPVKPYLVLTHTTAGVAALRKRLTRANVPAKNYVLSTIDGWSVRIASSFSQNCQIASPVENSRTYYPELRNAVSSYLATGSLHEVIRASYSRLIVDEYQDCNQEQHNIVCSISQCIPTTVLGDPMQLIFNFRGTQIPSWQAEVLNYFPLLTELNTPWRWINAQNQELGEWVLECRRRLAAGNNIDLTHSPNSVSHIQLSQNHQENMRLKSTAQYQLRNAYPQDSLLVIGNSINANSRHLYASQNNGIDVVEPVDLRDLVTFSERLDVELGEQLATCVINIFGSLATGMGSSHWVPRIRTILAGRNRNAPSLTEAAIIVFIQSKTAANFLAIMNTVETDDNIRVYRRAAFSALKSAINSVVCEPSLSFKQGMERARESLRQRGDTRIPNLAIGSTLLLKGLEADHSLIIDVSNMNSQNLYVALSRGAKTISIASSATALP